MLFLFSILLSTLISAYYPNQNIIIPALYTEDGILTSVNGTINIYSPYKTKIIDNETMYINDTGILYYNFTFLNDTYGNYLVEVNFYQGGIYIGTGSEEYEVFYNLSDEIINISTTTTESKTLLESIWDFFFGDDEYNTQIYGRLEIYQIITFKTTANFILDECDLTINSVIYNMDIDDYYATYYYYINEGGLYEWEVYCI